MSFGRCRKCKRYGLLTKHSKTGSHKPPYILLCEECHNEEHGIKRKRFRRSQRGTNGKRQKGTRRK